MLGGPPALRLLVRLKLRGAIRKQARRMRTPSGLVLTLVGGLLFALWLGSLVLHWLVDSTSHGDPDVLASTVGFGALVITILTLSSALTHRGLFVPREEIERLFSAPISRSDLIRYRLTVNLGRGAFGGLVLGLVVMRHMPRPLCAFAGSFVALETLPVLGQAAAILAGALERRAYKRVHGLRLISIPLTVLAVLGLFTILIGDEFSFGRSLRAFLGDGGIAGLSSHPVAAALTLPFAPWARAIAAPSVPEFLPWFAASLAIWLALYAITARLPVDFRELSLETSASVAERIRRMRRGGGGAAAGKVTAKAVGLRVPWLFGRGPGGAVAWRKSGAILRKARGTLIVSVVVLAFVTMLSIAIVEDQHDDDARVAGAAVVAVLGMFYLAGGLRFDFRDELDRMESIKAWPLSSTRLFVAMLLPEVVLVSALIGGAVLLRASFGYGFEPFILAIVAAVPLVVFAWVALDNAVFLLMPVRPVPGQEGALQNAGRAILLLLLRGFLIAVVGTVAGGGGYLAYWLLDLASVEEELAALCGFAVAWLLMLVADVGLVLAGAWTFRRFDVARDRG